MKNEKKQDRSMNIVANVNFIHDSFNKKSFNSKDLKAKCKTLKVPYPEDLLKGLIEKNKVVKLNKDQYKFKDNRPIFHFIIEELLKDAQTKHAKYQKKHREKKTFVKEESAGDFSVLESLIEMEKFITPKQSEIMTEQLSTITFQSPLEDAINFVKSNGYKVFKQVVTLEEV